MNIAILLVIGLLVAAFVGFNIGGSSTGVTFGPAVGSKIIGKSGAAALFTIFAFLGGWTVGRNVVETMGGEIVPASQFTLEASVVVLFFTGLALLVSNLFGVPASTSMTAVGAIVGLGLASGTLNEAVMFEIVSAWIVAPVIAFWAGAVVGRYLYPYLDTHTAFNRIEGDLICVDQSGSIPRPTLGENATSRDLFGAILVLTIACYMAFSAGASNTANAIAPLVGSGVITIEFGIILAAGTIGFGAFTIARRTLDTVGEGLTDLSILGALIVATISATVITALSQLGIPASRAVSATMCIVGLGWGRASRATLLSDAASAAIRGEGEPNLSTGALAAGETTVTSDADRPSVPEIGEEDRETLAQSDLYDPRATSRVMVLWVFTPTASAIGSYLLFSLVFGVGG